MKGTPVVFVVILAMAIFAVPALAHGSSATSHACVGHQLFHTQTAEGVGRVPWPVAQPTQTAEGVGRVPWPIAQPTQTAEGVGRVPWPVAQPTQTAEGVGRVPWPVA